MRLGPRQVGPPPHVHDDRESWTVIEGRLEVSLDGEWRTLTAGEQAFAASGTPHALRNPFDEPVTLINSHRPGREMEAFFTDMAALSSSGRLGWGPPHGPREAIYGSLLMHAHSRAMHQSRPQRAVFAALAWLGGLLGARL